MTGPSGAGQRVVGGRYRLIEPVGRGGMGTVWRAQDELLGRPVAVKEVDLPQLGAEVDRAALRERTMREARAAAQLSHPNAVTVYDVISEDGHPFIIMALLAADSLAEVIRDRGPLPPTRVAEIGLAVLGALQAAHAAGILHRDVKPGNVLLGHDGRVVLTDFGIATLEGDSSLTTTGLLMGAPAYISPERARGLQPGPAADLWSLGATLYAAVEGRPPFDRETPMATLTALISEEPPVPRLAGPLTPVLTALLERDPERRIDAATARRMLEAARTGTTPAATRVLPAPVPAPASGARERGAWTQVIRTPAPAGARARPRSGPSAAVLGLLALALVGAVVVAVVLLQHRKAAPAASPASPRPSARPSPTARRSPTPSPKPSPTPSPTPSPPPSPSPGAGAVPSGFRLYTDPAGFSVAVPTGWQKANAQRSGHYTQVDFVDPTTPGRFLRFAATDRPKSDPVADWTQQEKSVSKKLPGYRRISIAAVRYRGFPAADWNFTFQSGTGRTEVLDRGFTADAAHGNAIYLSAPAVRWADSLPYFSTAADTFQPG